MSFLWFNRKFYDDFVYCHSLFNYIGGPFASASAARLSDKKIWFNHFNFVLCKRGASAWKWGLQPNVADENSPFFEEVERRIPADKRFVDKDILEGKYGGVTKWAADQVADKAGDGRWFTTNQEFLFHAMTNNWKPSAQGIADQDVERVVNNLYASLGRRINEHAAHLTTSTILGGSIEFLGAAQTFEGMFQFAKLKINRKLELERGGFFALPGTRRYIVPLVRMLAYPISAFISNWFVVGPTIEHITTIGPGNYN